MKKTASIGATILLCIAANAIFVGAQKLWHSGDQRRLNEIQVLLDSQTTDIAQSERALRSLDRELDQIEARLLQLENQIEDIEDQYPDGAPTMSTMSTRGWLIATTRLSTNSIPSWMSSRNYSRLTQAKSITIIHLSMKPILWQKKSAAPGILYRA